MCESLISNTVLGNICIRDIDLDFVNSIDDLSYYSCFMKRLSRAIILITHMIPDALLFRYCGDQSIWALRLNWRGAIVEVDDHTNRIYKICRIKLQCGIFVRFYIA